MPPNPRVTEGGVGGCVDAPCISNHPPVPYHVQCQHMFGIILFLNLESEGAGLAGELTACKSQCVRLPEGSTRGGDSARERCINQAEPSHSAMCRRGLTGHLFA